MKVWRSPLSTRATAAICVSAATWLCVSQASADTMTQPFQKGGAVAETPVHFGVSATFGVYDYYMFATIHVNPVNSSCDSTSQNNSATALFSASTLPVVNTPGIQNGDIQMEFEKPGTYLLCPYLSGFTTTTASAAPFQIKVRDFKSDAKVKLPQTVYKRGSWTRISSSTRIESPKVERWYLYTGLVKAARACGSSYSTTKVSATGHFKLPVTTKLQKRSEQFFLPNVAGRYKICGWIARDESDTDPHKRFVGPKITLTSESGRPAMNSEEMRQSGNAGQLTKLAAATMQAANK